MSRRSDREGIAPENLCGGATTHRWFWARNLANAAGWRKRIAKYGRHDRERAASLSWHRYEVGLAKGKRQSSSFAALAEAK